MEYDAELLARIQFAVTIMFHYLFPPLTIGLGWIMVLSEGTYVFTGNKTYERIARFWTKIFAVNFAMGVASGIVMEFQFGTNWATYSRFVGDVFGSALAAEGIFAFFLESGFLAVLVFGWDRVSSRVHFLSTLMVALGSTFSAIWIVVANSWQQTPAGSVTVGEGLERHAQITDFWAVVFNPSSMHRLGHVLIGSLMAGAFFVMSISAYYILTGRHLDMAKKCFTLALVVGLLASLAAPISGHFQAREVAQTQPAKLAAFEGHFTTSEGGTPLWVFGIPDEEAQRVRFGIPIPGLLSFLVHESFSEPVTALDSFPQDERPPVQIPFQSYHLMIAVGMFSVVLTLLGVVYRVGGSLFERRRLLWVFVFAVLGPYVGNQTGWIAAEVGRQPWVVYGQLRTDQAISASVSGGQILGSLVMFVLIYPLLFLVWLYIMNDKIQHGPEPPDDVPRNGAGGLLEAAVQRADSAGESMTEARSGEDAATDE